MREDKKERNDLIKDIIEYIKPYLNIELYQLEKKSKKENDAKLRLDNKKIQKEFNTEKVQFELDNVGADVFDENIPMVMEK